jgi:TRAP-type mannitol/chloroaromatic compound transport system permease small subunit
MPQAIGDNSARLTITVIGVVVGLYALGLALFGEGSFEPALLRRWPVLYIAGIAGLAAGAMAFWMPAVSAILLIVGIACWFGLAFVFDAGVTVWTVLPLIAVLVGTGLAVRAAGASELLITTDRMSILVGKLFAFSVLILTVVVCYEVFMRYVLRMPTRWGYDAGYMLYGAGFLMAGAYAVAQNAHVRADVIYRFWRPRVQASVDLVLYLLFFFPAAFFFIYQGYIFAERSWIMGEFSSASPFRIPVYHFKTLIPLAGMFLFLQGIAELFRAGLCLRDGMWPPRVSDVAEIEKAAMEGHLDTKILGDVPMETVPAGAGAVTPDPDPKETGRH